LLAQSVVRESGGDVRFVVENLGESALARRYGITRYPVIFVGDVLVATPKDFGFFGRGEGENVGRYTPLKSAASHERFRADLTRMIDLVRSGAGDLARASAATVEESVLTALPDFSITDLDGRPVTRADLAGKVVLVEFWATWCPPCRRTLGWLGDVQRRHPGDVIVLAAAIESDEADVREVRDALGVPLRWAMGTAEMARAFGDLSAVPTLFMFDRTGRSVGVHYGAPPDVERAATKTIERALR
jgi:thiol-disulfide isomerase/thioredoxin